MPRFRRERAGGVGRFARDRLTKIKSAGPVASGVYTLAGSVPANASGIVASVVGITITVAWLAYLYR
jgi:hypothetical protein